MDRVGRLLSSVLAVLILGAPAGAQAGEVSGALVGCDEGDICRYFPNDRRLDVTFRAAAGEENELRLLPHPDGVRIVDAGAAIVPGAFCTAVDPNDVRCGPPASAGLAASAYTGDGRDSAFARTGFVDLGAGRDLGLTAGASLSGGTGNDELRAWSGRGVVLGGGGADQLLGFGGGQVLFGGTGRDFISAGRGADSVHAGPGVDRIAGGQGRDTISGGAGDDFIRASDPDRDVIRCGRGKDRVFIGRRDRVFGCERITYGWDG